MKWKAFNAGSLNALLSRILQVKKTADDNSSAVSHLGEDLAKLALLTEEGLSGKQDKGSTVSFTIPTTGWASDTTKGYPKYYDVAASGVTSKDRAEVTLSASSLNAAMQCGLCQTCETLAGKIRIRAMAVPSASMEANYWIEKGM